LLENGDSVRGKSTREYADNEMLNAISNISKVQDILSSNNYEEILKEKNYSSLLSSLMSNRSCNESSNTAQHPPSKIKKFQIYKVPRKLAGKTIH